MQFWKNGRLLLQNMFPLEHTKKNNSATLYQASLRLGCTQGSFYHPKYCPLENKADHSILIQTLPKKTARDPVSTLLLF